MSNASEVFAALESHDLDRLASALSGGADPNAAKPSPPHWSPLHEAINELEDGGSLEALVLLLRRGAAVEGAEKDTPLLMALFRDQPAAVQVLLGAGANPNVRGAEGDSPLRVAVARGDHATAAMLLRCGARATIDESAAPVGASALGIAAKQLDVSMIQLLLKEGADPSARDIDGLAPRDRLPQVTSENQVVFIEAARLLHGDAVLRADVTASD